MKIRLVLAVAIITIMLFVPIKLHPQITQTSVEQPQQESLNVLIQGFLTSKESPLASNTDFLLQQKHWKLLIAISAIESQYCKKKLGNNCWGIGGDSAYRHYSSIRAAIVDANDLI